MAASVIVDTSFITALLNRRDTHHSWAVAEAAGHALPWKTCEAVLSEAFFLLAPTGSESLLALVDRGALTLAFRLSEEIDSVLKLMRKYADLPISLADACLVRMTETLPDPIVLTTDRDFATYRRHGRQVIPCRRPV